MSRETLRICLECGIDMVPNRATPEEGQRRHGARGLCLLCYSDPEIKERYPRSREPMPSNCVKCGIPMVQGSSGPAPEGTRQHYAKGLCSSCKPQWKGPRRKGGDPTFDPEQARRALAAYRSRAPKKRVRL